MCQCLCPDCRFTQLGKTGPFGTNPRKSGYMKGHPSKREKIKPFKNRILICNFGFLSLRHPIWGFQRCNTPIQKAPVFAETYGLSRGFSLRVFGSIRFLFGKGRPLPQRHIDAVRLARWENTADRTVDGSIPHRLSELTQQKTFIPACFAGVQADFVGPHGKSIASAQVQGLRPRKCSGNSTQPAQT